MNIELFYTQHNKTKEINGPFCSYDDAWLDIVNHKFTSSKYSILKQVIEVDKISVLTRSDDGSINPV